MENGNQILWYQNPSILFKNLDHIYPGDSLMYNDKINSIARLALYYSLIIIIFSINKKWLLISLILFMTSYYYSVYNNIDDFKNDILEKQDNTITAPCFKPTLNNPFMNYTLGDQYTDSNRLQACGYEDIKKEMRNKFRSTIHKDPNDVWGQYISDRNFYTMPNTNIVNNQVNFAKWCYTSIDSGECKTYGSNCIKYRDPKYHIGRLSN
jgi:hypothetical protein